MTGRIATDNAEALRRCRHQVPAPRVWAVAVLAVVVGVAAACGGSSDSDVEGAAELSLVDLGDGSEVDELAPIDGDLSFLSADGVALQGRVYGTGATGVVLAHSEGGSLEDWGQLPGQLAARNQRVLAFNFQGHGDSGGDVGSDPVEDVVAAVRYLYDEGVQEVVVLGAGDGASAAVAAGPRSGAVGAISLAGSADLPDGGTDVIDTPTLLLASRENPASAAAARDLEQRLADTELVLLEGPISRVRPLEGAGGEAIWAQIQEFLG